MTTWVVDDGPLGKLAQIFDDGWTWPAETAHVLQAVVEGAAFDHSGRRQKLLAMRNGGEPVIVQHAVSVGSPADHYLASHLRPNGSSATDDLGEHESIAWILHDGPDDAVFVTEDKKASYLALAELGCGRVATPFDLWDDLRSRALISEEQLRELCERGAKAAGMSIPRRMSPGWEGNFDALRKRDDG